MYIKRLENNIRRPLYLKALKSYTVFVNPLKETGKLRK